MSMISVNNLCVRYGNFEVLHDISFTLENGDFLALVGPNGSGKSTLAKTLIGLLKPTSGSILFNGNRSGKSAVTIGYLPQKISFSDSRFPATVEEVVSSGLLMIKSFPKRIVKADYALIDRALRRLRIENLRTRQVGRISGGQQQRMLLARALVSDPELLVLDEPTGALDPQSRECFYRTLRDLNRDNGVTILIVSHDSHAISNFARSILFLDREVLFWGSFGEFQARSSQKHYFGHQHDGECD